jgi:hypothetical protein
LIFGRRHALADLIEERPITALALALGLGILIGQSGAASLAQIIVFERISDRWKKDARRSSLGVNAVASLVIATVTLSFLCAAAFVIVLR